MLHEIHPKYWKQATEGATQAPAHLLDGQGLDNSATCGDLKCSVSHAPRFSQPKGENNGID